MTATAATETREKVALFRTGCGFMSTGENCTTAEKNQLYAALLLRSPITHSILHPLNKPSSNSAQESFRVIKRPVIVDEGAAATLASRSWETFAL
jgi:hypothetical protein